MRGLSLTTKINAIVALAVLIPLFILGILMTRTVRNLALDNLQAFVQESGSRRQTAIENDIRASLNALNEFISANQSLLILSLEQQYLSGIDLSIQQEIIEGIETRFETQLLNETDFFNSLRMVTLQYSPYATAVQEGALVPGSLQTQRAEIEPIVNSLQLDAGDSQTFGITNRDGVPHVEIVTALFSEDEVGSQSLLGYVLADLNLDAVFVENLVADASRIDTYAYVILPETNDVLAPQDIIDNNLIDTTSLGAQRALNNIQTTDVYEVGLDTRSEVVGYAATLTVDREVFAIVAEANTSEIFAALTQQTLSQVFVIVLSTTVVVLIGSLLIANQMIVPPLQRLRTAILAIIRGDFETSVIDAERQDEVGSLATSFVDMREYIRGLTEDMNKRLRDRTRDVQVTQDISRAIANERDINTLMSRVVDLVVQSYPDIYHAQIFLLDEDRKNAVLRASTGVIGRELLSRGHKLGVGSVSVIGQVTEQGQVIIARDTAESDVHRQNEFLSDTRAELAIPLQSGSQVIGALDVQSKQRDSFDPEQVAALQTLADQITIAIENARLYAESQRLLRETQAERGRITREAWQDYLNQKRQADLTIATGTRTGQIFDKLIQAVYLSGKSVVGDVSSRNTVPFVVPISLRGQTLGVVEYEVPKDDFSYDKVLLAEELVSRLAISLENARLFQASQQAAERERVVNDISAKLTNQTQIEDILQTAVREIEHALRTPQVSIRLSGANGHTNGKQVKQKSQSVADAE